MAATASAAPSYTGSGKKFRSKLVSWLIVWPLVILVIVGGLVLFAHASRSASTQESNLAFYGYQRTYPAANIALVSTGNHKTWGRVRYRYTAAPSDPEAIQLKAMGRNRGKSMPTPYARLDEPTIIFRNQKDSTQFVISVDGSNEGMSG